MLISNVGKRKKTKTKKRVKRSWQWRKVWPADLRAFLSVLSTFVLWRASFAAVIFVAVAVRRETQDKRTPTVCFSANKAVGYPLPRRTVSYPVLCTQGVVPLCVARLGCAFLPVHESVVTYWKPP